MLLFVYVCPFVYIRREIKYLHSAFHSISFYSVLQTSTALLCVLSFASDFYSLPIIICQNKFFPLGSWFLGFVLKGESKDRNFNQKKDCGMRNLPDLQAFLPLAYFSICLILSFIPSSNGLKCYQCTSVDGFPSSHTHCMKNPGATELVDGFAGCLAIYGNWDGGQKLVVRAGYFNKQETGRVPSCFHQESNFAVESYFENLKFDALTRCSACDHADGCNRTTETTALGQDHKLLLAFSIIFSSYIQSNL